MPPVKRTAVAPAQPEKLGPVTAWGRDVEVLDGLDLLDKTELVGKPFLIETVWFEVGQRSVEYVYVEGQLENGTTFMFNDSSSGVRAQLEAYLQGKGRLPEVGQRVPLRLVVPKGLRFSTYNVIDERGREKPAKTYYLTASGKKAE